MAKSKPVRRRAPKPVLKLPDLEQSKSAALNSLTSQSSQRTYDHAIREFIEWYCSEPRLAFNKTVVTRYRMPGYALYGGSKIAPHYLVRVLAREVGEKGIAVNAISPTVIEGAGIYTTVNEDAPIKGFMKDFCPMGHMGNPEDVAT